MRRTASVAALAAALVGCVAAGPTTTTPTTTAPTTTPTTTIISAQGGPIPICLTEEPTFVERDNAGASGGDSTDAVELGRIEWATYDGCERIQIDFSSSSGAPALDPPGASAVFLRDSGVLRVSVAAVVTSSAVVDQLIDTELVRRAFVVRAADGSLSVDLHLKAPAEARMTTTSGPGRIVIDLRPGGPAYPSSPWVGRDLVVVEPVSGPVHYPFSMSGYALGLDRMEAQLSGSEGDPVTALSPMPSGDDAWSSFVVLFPIGPAGVLQVDLGGKATFTFTTDR